MIVEEDRTTVRRYDTARVDVSTRQRDVGPVRLCDECAEETGHGWRSPEEEVYGRIDGGLMYWVADDGVDEVTSCDVCGRLHGTRDRGKLATV